MYNTLLDDLEDDVASAPEEAVELVSKVVDDADGVDDDLLVADSPTAADLDAELKAEELLAADEGVGKLVGRSGADVSDADGRNSAAHAARGNQPGQAD